jgi:PAS domain S-box-containing protein
MKKALLPSLFAFLPRKSSSLLRIGLPSSEEQPLQRGEPTTSYWSPFLVGIAVIAVTTLFWWALKTEEQMHIRRIVAAEAISVKNEVTARMQARILTLVRMVRRWESRGKPSQDEWEFEAELNINNFPEYHAIAWVDPWFFMRWAVPVPDDEAAQDLNLVFNERRRNALEVVRSRREVAITHAVNLSPKGKGFLVYVPIFPEEDFNGLVVGIFRVQELFDSVLQPHIASGYGFAVFDDSEQLYSHAEIDLQYERQWSQATVIDLYGIPWRVQIWPQPELLATMASPLPEVVSGAGAVLAFLLALSVSLAQTARRHARAVEVANQGLELEIAERKRAEEEVRTLNEELEHRVEERTAQLAEANTGLENEILERKRIEQALRESEGRYRSLFEHASDGIVSYTLDGIITDVNRELETMLGWSRDELVRQHYRKIAAPASAAAGEERIRRALAGERLSPLFEAEAVRKDGTIVPVEIRASLLHDKTGTPIGILAILREISARKALERQRAEFLAMLTHDIKNPLSVALGYAELLLEQGEEQTLAEREKDLGQLRNNIFSVFSLVDNYLNVSLIEEGKPTLEKKPVQLNDLLLEVVQQYEPEARQRHITLEVDLQRELPLFEGDPRALGRVIANLLYNALKFTPEEGSVTISSVQQNGAVIARFADTGPGINPEEIPLLFEKYRQGSANANSQGIGLGLFIVKALVEAHGGRIEVQSTPRQGTCFSVVLPVLQ